VVFAFGNAIVYRLFGARGRRDEAAEEAASNQKRRVMIKEKFPNNEPKFSKDLQNDSCFNRMKTNLRRSLALIFLSATFCFSSYGQPRGQQGPRVVSPEVAADRQITFRILAPKAESVQLASSGDIPGIGFGQSKAMTKGTNGVWDVTVGPLPPGAYRYSFNVGGVITIDPRNPKTSESNENTWSLVQVPGADWM